MVDIFMQWARSSIIHFDSYKCFAMLCAELQYRMTP